MFLTSALLKGRRTVPSKTYPKRWTYELPTQYKNLPNGSWTNYWNAWWLDRDDTISSSWYGAKPKPDADGYTPVNPFTVYRRDKRSDWVETLRPPNLKFRGPMWAFTREYWTPNASEMAVDESKLAAKLVDKVKQQALDAAVAAGEGKESFRTLLSGIQRITRAARSVKRGNVRDALNVLGQAPLPKTGALEKKLRPLGPRQRLANGWLELQYGWLPIVNDCFEAANALETKFLEGVLLSVQVSTKVEKTEMRQDMAVVGDLLDLYSGRLNQQTNRISRTRVVVRQWYKIHNPTLARLTSLGVTNPMNVVWELVPYSFVVDWFFPIGTWINAADVSLGKTYKGGYRATSHTSHVFQVGHAPGTGIGPGSAIGHSRRTFNSYSRQPLTSWYKPPLPNLQFSLGAKRIASALALLSQTFDRRHPGVRPGVLRR